ncbi:PQQ-binding-like beta-propeller repeat protein [Roseiconus lacunae]|uniref:PQQ-binding-like beta-propeller repeat protein n=1 Tax=Roseiconus lacunae TaxID=2605694 RepID=UPI003085F656|nr:PQQ-binding-like beta-propeller repeat protein [Stieleria sp. HD01]
MKTIDLVCLTTLVSGLFLTQIETATSQDWPFWRGPSQNSHAVADGLIDSFNPKGGNDGHIVWFNPNVGGISTPIVMNGMLFTIVRHDAGKATEAEKVVALDAITGKVVWENIYNVFLTDFPAERIGWSNVTGDPETNKLYVLGSCSLMQCLDAASGKTLWARSLSEEFGMLSTYGGRTNTPVLFEDLAIISGVTTGWDSTARPCHRFFAFDKHDGRLVWQTDTRPLPEDTTYSTPVITTIAGQTVMIAGAGDGELYAIQPRTGRVLWHHPISRRGINTSPTVSSSGIVFVGHSEENPQGTAMGAVVAIDTVPSGAGSLPRERWRALEVMAGKASPLLIEDELLGSRIYAVEDSGRMRVLDALTGEEICPALKLGTAMRGTPLYADNKLYTASLAGIVHVLQPTEGGLDVVIKTRLPGGQGVNGSMIAAGGCVFLPTTAGIYCLGTSGFQPKASPSRDAERVASVPDFDLDSRTAVCDMLQLVPAEAIVSPGQQFAIEVRAFDELGHQVDLPVGVQFQVNGPATIDSEGVLSVNTGAMHEAITVLAVTGDSARGVTGSARFRVVPPLPWSFDFSNNEVPVTWVGARYRHEARSVDGEAVIAKLSTIPKGTRSQAWFGPTDLSSYTITADVKAVEGTDKLPDIGLIGQRYVLDLMGESQQLQVRTWAAQLRMAKSQPVSWRAGVWYTLKLQATLTDDVAEIRGKVWPRHEAEPDDWTVVANDAAPNHSGSPGLFGNATNAEVLIDNVTVTR